VWIEDVGREEFQEAGAGVLAGSGDNRRHGIRCTRVDTQLSQVEGDGELVGHQISSS
jgi:hypothetical protein